MKIFTQLLKTAFNSGKPIGMEMPIAEATTWLKNHSKGVGEQLGNLLKGKANKINDKLIKGDLYNKLFAQIDEVAQQYPNATVKVAAKNAKKGGFKIGKIEIKDNNGKTVYNQAVSVTDDLKVKSRATNSDGAVESAVVDRNGVRATATSPNIGTVKTNYNMKTNSGDMKISNPEGNEIAIAHYDQNGNPGKYAASVDTADNLVSAEVQMDRHNLSFIGDKGELKNFGKNYQEEVANQQKKLKPIVLELLRPLRERFNTAIDLFKYNGRKNYERFLSKDELEKSVKELNQEANELVKKARSNKITTSEVEYYGQIKSDIYNAEKLIEITI